MYLTAQPKLYIGEWSDEVNIGQSNVQGVIAQSCPQCR